MYISEFLAITHDCLVILLKRGDFLQLESVRTSVEDILYGLNRFKTRHADSCNMQVSFRNRNNPYHKVIIKLMIYLPLFIFHMIL